MKTGIGFIVSKPVERFIIGIIIINAITLGLETNKSIVSRYGVFLLWFDHIALGIYTVEIILKTLYLRSNYFKDPWNIFDFLIVAVSYVPFADGLSVLRSLRVLRIFLLISAMPRLRLIVRSLILSLPSITSIALLLALLFYVSAVISTKIFGEAFPAWFGTLSDSLFTLFQLMTLESWAMGIVRPVCEQFAYAAFFFVPFVLLSAFIIMNLFIAVIINAMNEAREVLTDIPDSGAISDDDFDRIYKKLLSISEDIKTLSNDVKKIKYTMAQKKGG